MMDLFQRVPGKSKPFFKAALADTFGAAMTMGVVETFAGVTARRLGATPAQLWLISTGIFLGFLVAAPLARLSVRFRWGVFAAVAAFSCRAALLTVFFVRDAAAFVWIIVISHLLRGGLFAVSGSLFKSHLPARARAGSLGWLRVIFILVLMPVAWLAGKLLDVSPENYRYVFPGAAVSGLFTCWGYAFLKRRPAEFETAREKRGWFEGLRTMKEDRMYTAFILVFFVAALGEKVGFPVTPFYFVDVLNLRYEEIGLAIGVFGPLLGAAGYLFWGRMLRDRDPMIMLAICVLVKTLRPVLWAAAGVFDNPMIPVTVGECVFRFCVSGIDLGLIMTVIRMSGTRNVPVYFSVHYGFLGIRGILGPAMGWAMLESGMSVQKIYWVIAGIVFTGAVALWGLVLYRIRVK